MARVSLMSAAPAATPRMNPGRRNCTRWPAGSWANSTYSETGRQPHQMAGRTMTSVASQKPGTDSPRMGPGSVKTINDAMSSDGTATSRRVARYRRSTASAVEPGRDQSPAVVEPEVRAVVLQRAVPDGGVRRGAECHVVLLVGQVALKVVDDLAALGDVERAPLPEEEIGEHGVIDMTLVLRLAGIVLTIEKVVGIQKGRRRPVRHRAECPYQARRRVVAVLLLVKTRIEPDVLEALEDERCGVDQDGGTVSREAHRGREALRMAGQGEETPSVGGIVLV